MRRKYAQNPGNYYGLVDTPVVTSSILSAGDISFTRLTSRRSGIGLTTPIPTEESLVVAIQLQDLPRHELWLDGRPEPVSPYPQGGMSVIDLRQNPIAYLPTAFDCIQMLIPTSTLTARAAIEGMGQVSELLAPHGEVDPIMQKLANLVLPALANPARASRLFLDGLAMSMHAHLVRRYGGARDPRPPKRSGLAPWQERCAKDMIDANLGGALAVENIAAACGLSPSQFYRAFRETTGMPPHRWLSRRRIDKAKALLTQSALSLSEIASACGFADQSHFSRSFVQAIGTTPGAWRRASKQ
ncbi:AraC family transcriptional regulator [Burkholderia anthina]|uniref:AraC family transcriptional regulator n=1 Tax=Burkholderia anthina TaxID=179879 RepID=UPI0009C1777F|nr:AraC family transcriptional regulator [Burkholderia anthina]